MTRLEWFGLLSKMLGLMSNFLDVMNASLRASDYDISHNVA
jgi:hypothetical protein